MGVYVLTVAESKPLVCSLYLESELPVKGDRRYIIHVYTQVESRKTQPVICEVYASLHQFSADALSSPVISHCYPKVSGVSRSGVHVDTEREVTYDLTLYAGYDRDVVVSSCGQLCASRLLRGERKSERFRHSLWGGVNEVYGFVVFWFGMSNDHVAHVDAPPLLLHYGIFARVR